MDLKYCDVCTEIAIGASRDASGKLVCESCRGKALASAAPARDAAPPADGSPLSFLDDGSEAPPKSGALSLDDTNLELCSPRSPSEGIGLPRAGSSQRASDDVAGAGAATKKSSGSGLTLTLEKPPPGVTFEDVEEPVEARDSEERELPEFDKGLTLFSNQTIVQKKRSFASEPPASSPQDASGTDDADDAVGDSANQVQRPDENSTLMDPSMSMFSNQTIVARKKKHFGPSYNQETQIKIAVEDGLDEDPAVPLELPPNPAGCESPAPTAKRLQFHCLSCEAKLVIRPVKKVSKMICPKCSSKMYVDPDGHITAEHPGHDSARVPHQDGTIVPNLRRSKSSSEDERAPQPPAAGLPATPPAAAATEPPAVAPPPPALESPSPEGAPAPEDAEDSDTGDDTASGADDAPPELELPGAQAASSEPVAESPEPPPADAGVESIMRQIQDDLDAPSSELDSVGDMSTLIGPSRDAEVSSPSPVGVSTRGDEEESAALRGEIQHLDKPPESSLAALFQATVFGVVLAFPLLVLGSLISPKDSVTETPSKVQRVLESTGEVMERGLQRLADQLGEWF